MKRILSLTTVAAIMALMLVVMAPAALAVPPAGFATGCDGGLTNADHAVTQSLVGRHLRQRASFQPGEILLCSRNPRQRRGRNRERDRSHRLFLQLPLRRF